ncbi:MAG TPA: prolipoprotein diacylglyceryl transferase [Terriglobia bacterium]|nr:prolipoprotein diacylglyceryl transferase [Terriglobia bacterium]
MHPILIDFGWLRLPTYGTLFATALIAAIYTVIRLGRREGLDTNQLLDFSTWLLIVGLLGSKLLLILTDWSSFGSLGAVFSWNTLQAAGVFYGGFAAATFFAIWYIKVYHLPMLKVFDVYVPGIALAQSVGRLGCFAAGCDYGKPTQSFLGVVFTNPISHDFTGIPLNVRIYPTQIIESLATFLIFGILLWRFGKKKYDGQIFVIYLTLYGLARFFIEFLRGDEDRGFVFNHLLSTSQFIAIIALGVAAVMAWKLGGRAREVREAALPMQTKRARG